ncbi:MAG: sortase [Clostridia bacterium]|nr:sortase [Clostridia bacterium]
MNQILVSEKVYVTPKLKRKKRFYKIQFVLSILVVLILTSYYVYSEYDKRKNASVSKGILNDFAGIDTTIATDDVLVVALNERAEEIPQEPQILDQFNTVYKAGSGKEYKVDSILNIPSLSINYPVLSETTYELLKISITKFWGGEPNAVGNYCIVGHNYDGKDIFFGKLNRIQNGDVVELQDKTGQIIRYKVYNKFIVDPTDVACTSQLTNGRKEMTLITCSEGGKTRLVVKCRAE